MVPLGGYGDVIGQRGHTKCIYAMGTYTLAVAELVECEPRVLEIGSSVPDPVKPMTYQIDACHFLA